MSRRRLKKMTKVMAGAAITGTLILGVTTTSYAAGWTGFGSQGNSRLNSFYGNILNGSGENGMQGGVGFGMQGGMDFTSSNVTLASSPSEIVTGTTTNSAQYLTADTSNAVTYVMSDSNNEVKIDSAGTYIITGTCSDGNITVKKNTTGVVLILKNLDLTSTTGATLSCNKNSEVKIIVEGTVNLTDAEDPADENSSDADVADAFDGAALKVKDGASVYLTGTGTLNIDASSCKNGIKVGNDDEPSLIIDGNLSIYITAANDAINSGYDLAILGGNLTILAGDDAIHADRILTIGEDGEGPTITISKSYEGLEGTIVNLFGGNVTLNASDDGINAANSDGTYADLGYSINITDGTYTVKSTGDGLDSNGNINITGGYTTISSSSVGGEAGIDYDGTCYIAEGTINNYSGISGPDAMPGQMGTQGGMGMQQGQPQGGMGMQQGQPQSDMNPQQGQPQSGMDTQSLQIPAQPGTQGGMNFQQGQPQGGMNSQQRLPQGSMGMQQGQPQGGFGMQNQQNPSFGGRR